MTVSSASLDKNESTEIFADREVDHTVSDDGTTELLNPYGLLEFQGWSSKNKVLVNFENITGLFGSSWLDFFTYKQYDEIHMDINGWRYEIIGTIAGSWLHFGSYRVNMYNWKTGERLSHKTYVLPWDGYVFQGDVYSGDMFHYKSQGLELKIKRGNRGMVGITLSSEILDLSMYVLVQCAKQGALHISKLTQDGKYWAKSWKTANEPVRHSVVNVRGEEYNSKELELIDSDRISTSSLRINHPVSWKKKALLHASFTAQVQGSNVVSFVYN